MNKLSQFNKLRWKTIDRADELFRVIDEIELKIFGYRGKGKIHNNLSIRVKTNMRGFEIGVLTELKPFQNF